MNLPSRVANLPALRLLRITAAAWGLCRSEGEVKFISPESIAIQCMPPSPIHPKSIYPKPSYPKATHSKAIHPRFISLVADRQS